MGLIWKDQSMDINKRHWVWSSWSFRPIRWMFWTWRSKSSFHLWWRRSCPRWSLEFVCPVLSPPSFRQSRCSNIPALELSTRSAFFLWSCQKRPSFPPPPKVSPAPWAYPLSYQIFTLFLRLTVAQEGDYFCNGLSGLYLPIDVFKEGVLFDLSVPCLPVADTLLDLFNEDLPDEVNETDDNFLVLHRGGITFIFSVG